MEDSQTQSKKTLKQQWQNLLEMDSPRARILIVILIVILPMMGYCLGTTLGKMFPMSEVSPAAIILNSL